MRLWIVFGAVLVSVSVLFADEPSKDTIDQRSLFVGVNAGSLLSVVINGSLGVGASVEKRIVKSHGIVVEGSVSKGATSGWQVGGAYRYYFVPSLESNFVGLFARTERLTSTITDKSIDYLLEVKGSVIGFDYGSTSVWKSGFFYSWKIGYGYPLITARWTQAPMTTNPDMILGISKWGAGVDAGLFLGWCF